MEGKILERELAYQRDVANQHSIELTPVSPAVVTRYQKNHHWRVFPKELVFRVIQEYVQQLPQSPRICDFGCGDARNACELALVIDTSKVVAFDISPDLIAIAHKRVQLNKLDDRVDCFVGDAEQGGTQGLECDVMLPLDMLHHVDIRKTIPTILAGTKEGGLVVFMEPIAFSRRLQRIRDSLPVQKDVSPDERQLDKWEIGLLSNALDNPKIYYYRFLGRLIRFLPNLNKIDKGHPVTKAIILSLGWLDHMLQLLIPPLRRYYGYVVIHGRRRITNSKKILSQILYLPFIEWITSAILDPCVVACI